MPPFLPLMGSCKPKISAPAGRGVLGTAVCLLLVAGLLPISQAIAQDNAIKARAMVDSAIKLTNSDEAVKKLWQATDVDPTLEEPYIYLGLYYNSRADPANVVKVYQKLVKYRPNEVSAYLNIGEAYMSFSPPKEQDALVYYKKAYALDGQNSFAALRIGEISARSGNREEAMKYLRQALADSAKNPTVSAEAERALRNLGAL